MPRFYLAGFAESGLVSVYDRSDGGLRRQTPENTAAVGHLYTFEDTQDRRRYDLEALLSVIEGKAVPILGKLIAGDRLQQDERELFSVFLAFQVVRTPAAIEDARAAYAGMERERIKLLMGTEEEVMRAMQESGTFPKNGRDPNELARAVVKMVRDDAYTINVNDSFARQKSLQTWEVVGRELLKRDWMVLRLESSQLGFVTSDSPVVLTQLSSQAADRPIGYGSEHAQILFTLGPRTALVMSGSQGRTGRGKIDDVRLTRFNETIARHCHRYVYSADLEHLRSVVADLGLTGTAWRPWSEAIAAQRIEEDGTVTTGVAIRRRAL